MKIDRLLAIIIYLLNHELVSARCLAERFGVSVRTVQRDIESIEQAGIPVYSLPGAGGGYGIMESFKIDRQLLNTDDFYLILTALKQVEDTMALGLADATAQKLESLLPGRGLDLFEERERKLSIDFSLLGGDPRRKEQFITVKKAVDNECLLSFCYNSNKLESSRRVVEPLTVAFRWRSWYLYAWCQLRQDYRLFRISRIRQAQMLPKRFTPREKGLESYLAEHPQWSDSGRMVDLVLCFDSQMAPLVEEYHDPGACRQLPDGRLEVRVTMPDDNSLYGYLLSFGPYVQVLEPEAVRQNLRDGARRIAELYQ